MCVNLSFVIGEPRPEDVHSLPLIVRGIGSRGSLPVHEKQREED
jgi:hypothetical protein